MIRTNLLPTLRCLYTIVPRSQSHNPLLRWFPRICCRVLRHMKQTTSIVAEVLVHRGATPAPRRHLDGILSLQYNNPDDVYAGVFFLFLFSLIRLSPFHLLLLFGGTVLCTKVYQFFSFFPTYLPFSFYIDHAMTKRWGVNRVPFVSVSVLVFFLCW